MPYIIQISDAQLALITAALEIAPNLVKEHIARFPADDIEQDNLELLLDCLRGLPETQNNQPKHGPNYPAMIHGLDL